MTMTLVVDGKLKIHTSLDVNKTELGPHFALKEYFSSNNIKVSITDLLI